MKEIGEKLKETREAMGISLEEAAEDLKMRPTQIENIEIGNIAAFKDVFFLKYFIRDYSKYLGLNYEDMVNEFNEYLFDYTSKISIEDIKSAKANQTKSEKTRKIVSPYTLEAKKLFTIPPLVIYAFIILLILIIIYFLISINKSNDFTEDNQVINNVIR
jgi:cytoskeletal protein RodZ